MRSTAWPAPVAGSGIGPCAVGKTTMPRPANRSRCRNSLEPSLGGAGRVGVHLGVGPRVAPPRTGRFREPEVLLAHQPPVRHQDARVDRAARSVQVVGSGTRQAARDDVGADHGGHPYELDRMSAKLPEERVETPGRETRLTTAAEAAWLAAGSRGQIPGLRMSRRISSCVIGTGPPPNAPRPGRRPTPRSVASPLLFMRGPDGSRPGPTPLSVSVENVASDAGGRDGSPTAGASPGDTPPVEAPDLPWRRDPRRVPGDDPARCRVRSQRRASPPRARAGRVGPAACLRGDVEVLPCRGEGLP